MKIQNKSKEMVTGWVKKTRRVIELATDQNVSKVKITLCTFERRSKSKRIPLQKDRSKNLKTSS